MAFATDAVRTAFDFDRNSLDQYRRDRSISPSRKGVQATTPRRVRNVRYRKRARDLALEPITITVAQMCAGVSRSTRDGYEQLQQYLLEPIAQLHQRI
jgi:hypothetical protein